MNRFIYFYYERKKNMKYKLNLNNFILIHKILKHKSNISHPT